MIGHAPAAEQGGAPGRRYRCPKCKREVTVCVSATVACSRCERAMKRLPQSESVVD